MAGRKAAYGREALEVDVGVDAIEEIFPRPAFLPWRPRVKADAVARARNWFRRAPGGYNRNTGSGLSG